MPSCAQLLHPGWVICGFVWSRDICLSVLLREHENHRLDGLGVLPDGVWGIGGTPSQGMLGGGRVIRLPSCLSVPLSSVSRARLTADTGQDLVNECLSASTPGSHSKGTERGVGAGGICLCLSTLPPPWAGCQLSLAHSKGTH